MQEQYEYNGCTIRVNRVPERQFDSPNTGFGWAFRVEATGTTRVLFRLVVKSIEESNDANLSMCGTAGLTETKELIDNRQDADEGEDYCYQWHHSSGLQRKDCDEISPPEFRSPKP